MDNRFNLWLRGVYPSLETVERAIEEGIALTKQEAFDYYFKKFLFGEKISKKMFRSDVFKISKYYSMVFKEIFSLRKAGYCNKSAEKLAKKITFYAFMHKISGKYSISGKDSNGFLYITLSYGPRSVHTFKFNDKKGFTESMIALSTFLAVEGIEDDSAITDEYTEFLKSYLINTANEVLSGKKPEPYVYTGTKTLKGYILQGKEQQKREKDPVNYNNVIEFRVG